LFAINLDRKIILCSDVYIDNHRQGGVPYKSTSEAARIELSAVIGQWFAASM